MLIIQQIQGYRSGDRKKSNLYTNIKTSYQLIGNQSYQLIKIVELKNRSDCSFCYFILNVLFQGNKRSKVAKVERRLRAINNEVKVTRQDISNAISKKIEEVIVFIFTNQSHDRSCVTLLFELEMRELGGKVV